MSEIPRLDLEIVESKCPDQVQNPYPSRRRANEAALFVENKVVLTQVKDELVYDEQLNQFVTKDIFERQNIIGAELWQNANTEKNKLFELVTKVQDRLNKDKGTNETTNMRNCGWEELMSVVSTIGQRWKSSTSQGAQAWRCIEKLGQASGTLEVWLGLLPAGDYGICGAFKLAIGAANQHSRVWDCVFEALGDIPEAMESAQKYVLIYKDTRDHFLERKTFDLYIAILRALIQIMQYFVEDGFKKVFNLLLKQKEYKADLFKAVEEVKKRTLKIKDEAAQCLAARQEKMHRTIDETNGKVDEAARVLQMMYITLYEEMTSLNKKYAQLALQNQQRGVSPTSPSQQRTDGLEKSPKTALKRLLKTLHASPSLAQTDLQITLSTLPQLTPTSQTRAATLVQHPLLRSWLSSRTSRSLLINGHQDLSSISSASALSFVAATLINITPPSTIKLSYLCSLHPRGIDPRPEASPRGILASLIQQLISQILVLRLTAGIDTSFLAPASLHRIAKWDPKTLYRVFQSLIQGLPPYTVVILVLDELALYETRELGKETDALMRRITRLVEYSRDGGAILKLLVTCRGRALDFGQYFFSVEGEVLDLEEEVEVDESAGWKISVFAKEG